MNALATNRYVFLILFLFQVKTNFLVISFGIQENMIGAEEDYPEIQYQVKVQYS